MLFSNSVGCDVLATADPNFARNDYDLIVPVQFGNVLRSFYRDVPHVSYCFNSFVPAPQSASISFLRRTRA